jgi:hypothetical protein
MKAPHFHYSPAQEVLDAWLLGIVLCAACWFVWWLIYIFFIRRVSL